MPAKIYDFTPEFATILGKMVGKTITTIDLDVGEGDGACAKMTIRLSDSSFVTIQANGYDWGAFSILPEETSFD